MHFELWGLWEGESSVVLPSAQGWQHPLALLMDFPPHQTSRKEKLMDEKLPHSRRTLLSPVRNPPFPWCIPSSTGRKHISIMLWFVI